MPKRKKKRTQKKQEELDASAPNAGEDAPRAMVFKRGKVGISVTNLIANIRRMLQPNCAVNLKESKKNTLKDFLAIANPLGVTHFAAITQTNFGVNLRLMRTPNGPTLTFRVEGYSLMADVANIQKRPHSPGAEFLNPPLLVLNNFSGKAHEQQLMAAMFQNLFPDLDVKNMKLSQCRRIVLIHRDNSGLISLRHYVINASPVGLTKSVKAIIKGKTPNLASREDIDDWVLNPGQMSDSEVEDTPDCRVVLPQNIAGRGNKQSQKSAIRLKEIGPRIALKLLKIEEGLGGGAVIYHDLKEKTEEEKQQLKQNRERNKRLKRERKAEQEANVKKKQQAKEARKKAKQAAGEELGSDSEDGFELPESAPLDHSSDDDEAYYREAVGKAPEMGLFARKNKRKADSTDQTKQGGNHKRAKTKSEAKNAKAQKPNRSNGGSGNVRSGTKTGGARPRYEDFHGDSSPAPSKKEKPFSRGKHTPKFKNKGQSSGKGGSQGKGKGKGKSRR